jgi:putative membrane protein
MDATFITNAANSNMEEVQLGKLAEAKAISESVKKYARMIQNDHNNANDKLKNLAMTNSITVDSAIKSENRQKVNDLSTLSGASFDKEYINLMVENNQKDIQEFENASSKVRNTQLKSWIDKTLPTLKKHLQEAQRIQNELNKM